MPERPRGPSRRDLIAAAAVGLSGLAPWVARGRGWEGLLGQDWRVPRGETVVVLVRRAGPSLADTLAALDGWRIPPGARVNIVLDEGEHQVDATLSLRHPDGVRLAIFGNWDQPERCRIVSQGPHDLIYVGQNHVLGQIDGVTIEHTLPANRGLGSGLIADEGGVILTGERVKVTGFYYGFTARRNGTIRCTGTMAERGGDCNYFAFQGGHISAQRATAVAASDPPKGLGSGFAAEYGGSIDCASSRSILNHIAGYTALSGGAIRAYGSVASRNGYAGYYATAGGTIVAHDGTTETNCGSGIVAEKSGSFHASTIVDQYNLAPKEYCTNSVLVK